jgi:hypothetical protein
VRDLAGEVGENGGSTASVVGGLVGFNGGILPSREFRFGDLVGGGGMRSVFAFVLIGAGITAGLGLVPRWFGNSERGGMVRPPEVLGLRGMAGSSASACAGGTVPVFCGWTGITEGGGANWDCDWSC